MSIFQSPARLARVALVAVSLVVGCGGGGSSSEAGGGDNTSGGEGGGGGESMSLDAFAAELARQTAPQLCGAPDAPLRACFEVDERQCNAAFTVAMTECANQLRADLPATVDASNAEAAATPISQCAGAAYRMGLDQNGLVRQTPECNQPAQ